MKHVGLRHGTDLCSGIGCDGNEIVANVGGDLISIPCDSPSPSTFDCDVIERDPVSMSTPDVTKVREYITHIETSPTSDVCLCLWRKHPDDTNLPMRQARKYIVDHNEECPVHSPEGRILGFFTWLNRDPEQDAAKLREREAAAEKERLEAAASFSDVITEVDKRTDQILSALAAIRVRPLMGAHPLNCDCADCDYDRAHDEMLSDD